mgnify:CR=1 FL=1
MAEKFKNIKGMSMNDMMKESSSKMYPGVYVSEGDIPEIDSWEVGKEYVLEVKVKMTSKDEYADGRDTNARLEIIAYNYEAEEDEDPSTPKMSTSDGYMPK